MTSALHQVKPAPLPASTAGLQRKSLRTRTLNDHVEEVFDRLYDESEEFRRFLEAVWNEDSVEGSLLFDDGEAARMIRDAAPETSPIKKKNMATIRKSLLVVLRRWGISRAERRDLLDGQIIEHGMIQAPGATQE